MSKLGTALLAAVMLAFLIYVQLTVGGYTQPAGVEALSGISRTLPAGTPALYTPEAGAISQTAVPAVTPDSTGVFEIADAYDDRADLEVSYADESGDMPSASPEPESTCIAAYPLLSSGMVDPAVRDLKLRLYELGYYLRKQENNLFSEATAEVVMEFQLVNGLPADGVATPETQELLFSDNALPKP